jgi:hypothetical protein
MIGRLIKHDPEALALWTEATRQEAGGDRQSEEARKESIVNNVHDAFPARPQGNSREAALRRLAKEAANGNEAADFCGFASSSAHRVPPTVFLTASSLRCTLSLPWPPGRDDAALSTPRRP